MAHELPRPTAPLPILEDPDHAGLFVVRHIGTLALLLVLALGTGMALAGSLVRLTVSIPDAVPPRTESVSLGTYVFRQLKLWSPSRPGDASP
ncbi:hypothetical protein COCOR_01431 [Corallococcus coralloides DSM 2259]|uniref:Uncharacterized protein n=1 Tax=Corallococcus coralloides (strain ATCC 25202 / DSM 2259 / NBRC 100086 / M2) TaxID=1144275 RepID=H8MV82_CORCM|nr:hypothetical protein [Corallococcus coralloides]AFE04055.1 hypothetical protein COCOR_01431 [Corallococcus coralloides DSM 2259]